MRSGRRVASAFALVAAVIWLLAVAPSPAAAGEGDVDSNPFQDGTKAGVELTGAKRGESLQGPGMPGWLRECNWHRWTLLEQENYYGQFTGAQYTGEQLEAAGMDPDEEWHVVFCAAGPEALSMAPQVLLTGILATWLAGEPLPQVVNDWLIAYALALIEIPVQEGTSSPYGDVVVPIIAQMETWLWVDAAVWQPVSATTPPVFGVTATVTAAPYRVEYSTSEGEYIDCGANTGTPYNVGLPASAQSTSCSVIYRDASSVADQTLTSTVRWGVTWLCSSSCGSGTLPDFVITNTRDVRVAELLGVGTSIGRDP